MGVSLTKEEFFERFKKRQNLFDVRLDYAHNPIKIIVGPEGECTIDEMSVVKYTGTAMLAMVDLVYLDMD